MTNIAASVIPLLQSSGVKDSESSDPRIATVGFRGATGSPGTHDEVAQTTSKANGNRKLTNQPPLQAFRYVPSASGL
jgi:hypothetical protein